MSGIEEHIEFKLPAELRRANHSASLR
jgi:hypothetical protein